MFRTQAELDAHIGGLQEKMKAAAANLDFEKAAAIRDDIKRLRNRRPRAAVAGAEALTACHRLSKTG